MIEQPFRSDVFYSVQNEDYRTELAVLDRIGGDRQRVLMIASSGENLLSMLTRATIASIDAVDLSGAQVQLCELRWVAAEHLSRDEQLLLLGCDPRLAGPSGAATRLALYGQIRSYLSEAARGFWDTRRDAEIAFGIHHIGRNDRCMQDLAMALAEAGFRPLHQPADSIDPAAWQAAYQATMTPAFFQERFAFANEAIAGRLAALAPQLSACHLWALRQPDAARNPFVTTVFAGAYADGEEGLPLYLQHASQALLRSLGIRDRLRLHAGNMIELMTPLAERHGPYDLISISNISDWMNDEQFRGVVRVALPCLRPGGALLARAANSAAPIRAVIASEMQPLPDLDGALPAIERGPWFRTIAVGLR